MMSWIDKDHDVPEDCIVSLSYDELHDLCEDRKKEISALRTALHDTECAAHAAQKELARIRADADADHRELADLRELLFLQEQTDEEPETKQEIITLMEGFHNWRFVIAATKAALCSGGIHQHFFRLGLNSFF